MFKKKETKQKEMIRCELKKELIFEAIIRRIDAPTIYYYIEREDDKYYFKSGVSVLGSIIRPDEDYRLSIDVKSRYHYEDLKNRIIKKLHSTKYVGTIDCASVYINFPTDNNYDEINDKQSIADISVIGDIEFAFDIGLDMRIKEIEYVVLNSFSVNTKLYRVIHNKFYPYKVEKPLSIITKAELETLKEEYKQQFDIYNDKLLSDAIIKTLNYGYEDLLKEALFIRETAKFPEKLVVVHGWTARDLIEVVDMKICEAYYLLSLMRSSPVDCKAKLRNILYEYWPKLFDKEIELENAVQRDMNKNDIDSSPNIIDIDISATSKRKGAVELKKSVLADLHKKFLSRYTVRDIENDLKQYIIGQEELVHQVALFVYYHVLRQIRPELHNRPMLISGPSGSGKTEVWRVVKKLYKDYLRVEIVDGSSITQDGWSGQRKLATCLESLGTATIFIVDEFDKLASPSFSKGGDNVSHHIQSEFLKLLEGDYNTTGIKSKEEISINYDCGTLGLILIGAFEKVRNEKEQDSSKIGFVQRLNPEFNKIVEISDEDLIDFGVMPEIVGRISTKCTTNKLTAQQYLEIIKNENSKVSVLINQLQELGIDVSNCVNDDTILELTQKSQINLLGVRWVSSQIENLLLQKLAHSDIRELFKDKADDFIDTAKEINQQITNDEQALDEFFL